MTNGQSIQFATDIIQLRTKAADKGRNAGQFAIRCLPVKNINESGAFFRTDKQMTELAQGVGIDDWRTLSRAIARGGCRLLGVATFCKEGESPADNPTVVYSKDWYRVENLVLELSEAALKYVDGVTTEVDIRANMETSKENALIAHKNRLAVLMGVNTKSDSDDDSADDSDDAEEVLEEEAPTTTGKAAKSAKSAK